jgi:hypothetical protein
VRDEPSGERRDTCMVAALTGDRGDSGALTNFIEGGWHPVLRAVKGVGRGRGKLSGALEWSEAVGRGKETEGEEGGGVRWPLKR